MSNLMRCYVLTLITLGMIGCSSVTPAEPSLLPDPTPISLEYLDSLDPTDILIHYGINGIGEGHIMSDLAPHFILYANGKAIYLRGRHGLYEAQFSKSQVHDLMTQLYGLGIENIRGYNYDEGCFTPVPETASCETDQPTYILRIRLDEFMFHRAEAYMGNQPAESKLDDAIRLLDPPDVGTMYQPETSTVYITYSELHADETRSRPEWPLSGDLLSNEPWHEFTIDAEQTTILIEVFGSNLTELEFVSDGRNYWGWLVPNVPGIAYPDF